MLADWKRNPIENEADYYHSNYELELLARSEALSWIVPRLPSLPLNWIDSLVHLPLSSIPFIGHRLDRAYAKLSSHLIESPLFNLFYYAPNTDPEMVRTHVEDGMESISPKLLEQIANAYVCGSRSEYHPNSLGCEVPGYDYAQVRKDAVAMQIPQLLIAGDRDRLASAYQIENFGYEPASKTTRNVDITFRVMSGAGHLDILGGKNTEEEIFKPVAEWMHARH
jgi:hypothetical protein